MDIKNAGILIVDDEAVNIKLLQRVLRVGKFTNVMSTQDPTTVIKMHRENNFHLIILDLNMPVIDGFQVLTELKNAFSKKLPAVLVLTAQSQQKYKQKALLLGANDYLTKPFDQVEILARVENMVTVKVSQELLANQNATLEKQVKERTSELAEAHQALYSSRMQVVRKLGRAAEYRDNETGFHIIRMSRISALLGRALNMPEEQVKLLLNASPMHDIGKIGIPDTILLKPGKLEPEEWKTMKTHSLIGSDILKTDNCELLNMAHIIALTHHEKYDGSGYPAGLKGKAIPIVGRICALADVFDALTSERPYKKPWSLNKTLNYIKENSGKHFDPDIVAIFFEAIEEILEIKDEYADENDMGYLQQYRSSLKHQIEGK